MGAAASVEGFNDLSDERKEAMKVKYDAMISEGKSEEEAIEALKAENTTPTAAETPVAASDTPVEAEVVVSSTELMVKTIPLTALQEEIGAAVAAGKTPLIVDNSEEDKVNTFFQYGSAVIVDGKKMGLDKTMQKIPVPDIMEGVRAKLSIALKNGSPLVIAMTKSCTDFVATFTDTVAKANHGLGDGSFLPIEMFDKAGKGLLESSMLEALIREEERESGVAVSKNADGFYIVLTTQFSPEDYEEFLFPGDYGLPTPKDKYQVLIIGE